MKKLTIILLVGATVVLAGCDKGGSGDQYNTSSGSSSSLTNSSSGPGPNSPQSRATSPSTVSPAATNSGAPNP